MRSFLVAMILMLTALPLLADKPEPLTTTFTVRSVTITGDQCILSVKDESIVYYTNAVARACQAITTGMTLTGYLEVLHYPFANPSSVTWIRFDAGYSNKGKHRWSPPFVVYLQQQ